MKVKIVNVTDFDGKEKDKWIWGEVRIADPYPPKVGERLWLYCEDMSKVRSTSEVKGIQPSLGNQTDYYTQNSIYRLEVIE